MMARVIDAKHSTVIGTAKQLRDFLRLLTGGRAAVVDLKGSNFVVLDKPLDERRLRAALETTPGAAK